MEKNLIVGIHSICEALKNPARKEHRLFCTKEGLTELKKKINLTDDMKVLQLSNNDFQARSAQIYKDYGHKTARVPSGVLLETSALEGHNLTDLYKELDKREVKIVILDRVTDVHNAAAILRTIAFYGAEFVIISIKGNFGTSPSFYRIASGATEHIKIINCASLPRAITKLKELNVRCLGFSEHAEDDSSIDTEGSLALVLGAEETGLSHSVLRVLDHKISFKPKGAIQSLNVSVASAVAMEKFFGPA